jgi:fructose-bisphosphate aldolase class I
VDGFYSDVMRHPRVLRRVALSGGYTPAKQTQKLARNPGDREFLPRAGRRLYAGQTDESSTETLSPPFEHLYRVD